MCTTERPAARRTRASPSRRREPPARAAARRSTGSSSTQPLVRAAGRGGVRVGGVASSTCSTPTSTCAAPTSSTRPTTTLGWSPPWLVKRLDDLGRGRRRAALDHRQPGARALRRPRRRPRRRARGCARSPRRACGSPTAPATGRSSRSRTRAGPRTVFGEPDVERLWDAVATAVRLDEPDPVAAWREHIAKLGRARRRR